MELKAENEYTFTEKLFREGMSRAMRDSYAPTVTKALISIAALWLVLALLTVRGGHAAFALLELAVVAAAC